MNKKLLWGIWFIASLGLAGFLAMELFAQDQKPHFLPGKTSVGHFQIELECSACHTESFADQDAVQQACVDCHGEELKVARDSHPKSKFTDPRNADRLARIDARYCVSCHVEHTPEITREMGVTQPTDFCAFCHQEIAEERPSHEGMGFETCASAGCHNYHDNQALYEDFLLEHASGPDLLKDPNLPVSSMPQAIEVSGMVWSTFDPTQTLAKKDSEWQLAHAEWLSSAHGEANVGCANCHEPEGSGEWQDQPGTETCQGCHKQEAEGFKSGRHGMRIAQGLSPMTPSQARIPMAESAAHLELTCTSCHGPHDQNTEVAATEACLGCHADEHSLAFEGTPHHATWEEFLEGDRPREAAVSCATCHLPREETTEFGKTSVRVNHNQNATLRPNEKMIRSTCLHCHSLSFSIDALASETQIQSNFAGPLTEHIPSIDMALERIEPSTTKPKNQGERP